MRDWSRCSSRDGLFLKRDNAKVGQRPSFVLFRLQQATYKMCLLAVFILLRMDLKHFPDNSLTTNRVSKKVDFAGASGAGALATLLIRFTHHITRLIVNETIFIPFGPYLCFLSDMPFESGTYRSLQVTNLNMRTQYFPRTSTTHSDHEQP